MDAVCVVSLPQFVCKKLTDGWEHIAPFFRHAGAHVTVRHNPIVVTTQPITGVAPAGFEVFDRSAMASMWSKEVREWAMRHKVMHIKLQLCVSVNHNAYMHSLPDFPLWVTFPGDTVLCVRMNEAADCCGGSIMRCYSLNRHVVVCLFRTFQCELTSVKIWFLHAWQPV